MVFYPLFPESLISKCKYSQNDNFLIKKFEKPASNLWHYDTVNTSWFFAFRLNFKTLTDKGLISNSLFLHTLEFIFHLLTSVYVHSSKVKEIKI